jgi:hypothetical protein
MRCWSFYKQGQYKFFCADTSAVTVEMPVETTDRQNAQYFELAALSYFGI